MLRGFIEWQRRLCQRFDTLLPEGATRDGNHDFSTRVVPAETGTDLRVYDVGAGRHPFWSVGDKRARRLHVTGLDIDAAQLALAPPGGYDAQVTADLTAYVGNGDADLVICRSLLEHVRDTDAAFRALASIARPGGTLLLFVPSRNALFARLNLLLPERLKRYLLYSLFPETEAGQGFPSYYDRCTPADFRGLARRHGLEIVRLQPYYQSSYFTFFLPLHLAWRAWIVALHALRGEQAAETFCMVLRKAGEGADPRR
jgi:SAM-dependent methyltransferase